MSLRTKINTIKKALRSEAVQKWGRRSEMIRIAVDDWREIDAATAQTVDHVTFSLTRTGRVVAYYGGLETEIVGLPKSKNPAV